MSPDFSSVIHENDLVQKDIARAETIPSVWYHESLIAELDRRAIFGNSWQYVGHSGLLADKNSVLPLTVAGQPLFLLRDSDAKLQAFYNVCLHRGGPIVSEAGNTDILQCGYHGWSYELNGKLRTAPHLGGAKNFNTADFCLKKVAVAEWEGLIFLHLGPHPLRMPRIMEGIIERISPIKLAAMPFHTRTTYDINCNWKVYIDNYLEGYHIPYVHPSLAKMLDYKNYVTEIYQHYSLQYSPLADNKNPYKTDDGEAYYYFIYPNFMLNILPGRLQTNVVIPLARNRCRVIFDYFYHENTPADFIKKDIAFADLVQAEDINICEKVQTGLESNAYDRGRFSPQQEKGVHHFQSMLKYAYQDFFNQNK